MRFNKTAALLAAALLVTMGVGGALAVPAQADDHAAASADAGGPAENASERAHAVHATIEAYLAGDLEAESLGAAVSDVAAGDDAAENGSADAEAETESDANESDDRAAAAAADGAGNESADGNESAANGTDAEPPEHAEDDEADEERTDGDDERDEAEEDRAERSTDDEDSTDEQSDA